MANEIIIKFDQVDAVLQGRLVLEGITFSLVEGSFLGIIGPNGAGKTTLLRLVLGLLAPKRGQVRVLGGDPLHLARKKRQIGYLPQKTQFDRSFPVCVRDVVLMGATRELGFFKLPGRQIKKAAEEVMLRIGISDLAQRPVGELSGGQQQLVLLAAALVSRPRLLILDEPTTGLDPSAQDKFYRLVKGLQADMKITVLAVSHDLAAISANAHRLLCINKTMHMHGSSSEVVERLAQGQLFKCEYEFLFGANGWRR